MELTPKQKAKELFNKYQIAGSQWYVETTKKYTLIAVDEIINSLENYGKESDELQNMENDFRYWQEVKEELLKKKNNGQ